MFGHKSGSYRTTEMYAKYDPSYLGEAARAIDAYFADLRTEFGDLAEDHSSTVVRSGCVRVVDSTLRKCLESWWARQGLNL